MNLVELSEFVADEDKAIAYVESLRWPTGEPVCPNCDVTGRAYRLKTRRGLWKCGACRKQFTVRVGSIFEGSPIPLGKWILAIHLMCSSKKGISANQLKRELGISYQSAWFLTHRVRLAMAQEPMAGLLGSGGGTVEVDETYIGGKRGNNYRKKRTSKGTGMVGKIPVMVLIERGGEARTVQMANTRRSYMQRLVPVNVDSAAHIMTDGHAGYRGLDKKFASHQWVDHNREMVRGIVHTNFAESYNSLLKRSIIGTYHHVSKTHLHRYLSEFEFRWNSRKATDGERTVMAIKATEGKRLTYRPLVTH